MSSDSGPDQPTAYEIRIKGHLAPEWTDWFDGLAITLENNRDTVLAGLIVDQAALHGVLRKVRDLGVPLISVSPRPRQRRRWRTDASRLLADTQTN